MFYAVPISAAASAPKDAVLVPIITAIVIAGGIIFVYKLMQTKNRKKKSGKHASAQIGKPPKRMQLTQPSRTENSQAEIQPQTKKTKSETDSSKDAAVVKLRDAKRRLNKLESLSPYGKLFESVGRALQILFGVAKAGVNCNPSDRDYYIKDKVIGAIEFAFRANGASGLATDRLVLRMPTPTNDEDPDIYAGQYRNSSKEEINAAVRRVETECRSIEIRERYKEVLDGLYVMFAEMKRFVQTDMTDMEALNSISVSVKRLLETNGIYPLFAGEPDIAERPDLKELFKAAGESDLKYPGLFIKRGGKLELLGSFNGSK
jgi:hypothetical protein